MEPSQPSYSTFGDPVPSSSAGYYPTPSDQPYNAPSSYPASYPPYPSSGATVYVEPGPSSTPSYQTGPTYSSPTYGTAENCCVDCCGLLCCAACFGMCAACLAD